ncbi:MAG TPA: glycosyltransferase family 87 protein [Bacteroidia bacterium]|nr:glycosyltransferase family 87 protein [Bacteroidia bacterium]
MAPLTYLPIVAQVFLWCGLSAGLLFLAIRSLPILEEKKRVFIYAFILIEYITSLQSMQVTAIMLACMLFSFTAFEKGKMSRAAFCIMLATFIKIYAIVAAIMFLMYPQKIKFLGYFVFWFIIFLFLPLLFISLDQFIWQYQNWYNVMTGIHRSEETGIHPNVDMPLSVMGWLKAWFHYNPPSIYIQLLGTALLCTPLVRFKSFINLNFRLYILSSILIWSMIFNHIAESPSYIVAVLGVAIWYTIKGNNAASNFLIITVFILTILSPTSLFPRFIRDSYILPYALKAVPCIAVWVVLQYTLLSKRFTTTLSGNL